MISVRQTLDRAWQHFQEGQWQQAEHLYLQVLGVDPQHVDALYLLAVIASQTGRESRAIDYFRATLRLHPGLSAAHYNLAVVLAGQQRLEEAMASYQQALRLMPDHAKAHNNLGIVLEELGHLPEAEASLQQAVRIKPEYADAHNNLGIVLWKQTRLEEAEVRLRQALHIQPDHAEAHNNLGNVLAELGRLVEAEACYRQALLIKPDYAEANFNLGFVLWKQRRLEEAAASYQHALRLKPEYAEAYNNLGIVLEERGQLVEAEACYQQALRTKPDDPKTYQNLGNTRKGQGRLDDAIAAYRTALGLKPSAADTHSNLILTLNYHPRYDARAIHEECARWNQQHAEPLKEFIRPHTNRPDPDRRLRIGYVSPDLREHVSSFFTVPLFTNHDHRQCEVFRYADVGDRLHGDASVWRSTVGLTDQQLADLVRSDEIDILVDLAMHTANNRLLVFARKPAPVQVAWLAYPGTTGLSAIDYRLTDPHLDPPGLFDGCYSEESVRLPETFWCYDPLGNEPPVNALPALANGVITFGSLNNFCKVNEECLTLWARVLLAVPQSRLVLLAPRDPARESVLARLEHEGITASRVEFAEKRPRLDYLKLYHRIDIALDPLPYNGHTTSLDAFWMGVPTLTLLGNTAVGRAGWSQLCNLGLQELAAETSEQHVMVAARLAGDLSRLKELRGTLRQRMQRSPLMDGKRFARHVEQAYRQMWRRWCRDQPRHEPA
jgi:predicted O-linked N-acetylglucosamine transferase (SPINDLY family)